jgi:tungstate transport system substrate-binding protein
LRLFRAFGPRRPTLPIPRIAARRAPSYDYVIEYAAGIEPEGRSNPWYREAGSGMGATLNIAAGMNAYTLTDRGTWLSFRNRRDLEILVEGDPPLFNQYGIMLVNPAKHPHVRVKEARALIDWITSPAGQRAIGDFTVKGQVLFIPNFRAKGGS